MVFSLPSSKASERVKVWRKLQKFGAIPFRNAGYLLPNSAENRERLIWIAQTVRGSKGTASVLEVISMDDLNDGAIRDLFREARAADYLAIAKDLSKIKPQAGPSSVQLLRIRRRFDEAIAVDFFQAKERGTVEALFKRLDPPPTPEPTVTVRNRKEFQERRWVTRHRPGIDRVSSAWLIQKFIDPKARFAFADKPEDDPDAIPFDMYGTTGFGHEGDCCTFETLRTAFEIKDKRVHTIAEAIHDADLEDRKYGRDEGHVIQHILQGWAKRGIEDHDLLRRGMELMDGIYDSLG